MKKLLSIALAALTVAASLAACTPAETTDASSASDDNIATYKAYLEENLEEMPDGIVLATAEDSSAYGVDMSAFADDGFFTRAEQGDVIIVGKTDVGLERGVRDFAKHGNCDAYTKTYHEGYRVKKLSIAGNDITEYAIVREDDADSVQTYASSELAKYIEKTCGAVIPQYTESEYAAVKSKPARTISLAVDYPELGDEAFSITVKDDGNMTILGGRYRGCMYGVYDLLNIIGWRFVGDVQGIISGNTYSPVIEYLYEADHIDLTSEINRTEYASIGYRSIACENDTYARNTNGLADKSKSSLTSRGAYGFTGFACHGLTTYHDQIFGDSGVYLGYDNERKQPCFTNEEVISCIETWVMSHIQSRLDAGQTIGKELVTVDISQWDTGEEAFCTCDSCRQMKSKSGSTMGAVLQMANRVATLVNETYPGVFVSILAYSGTNAPPRGMEVHDFVRVSYCIYVSRTNITCGNHPISGENCNPGSYYSNTNFAKEFKGWAALCKNENLDVWYYPMNCYNFAFQSPYFGTIFEDMKFFAENGVDGIQYLCNKFHGHLLDSLAVYVGAALAWDADMTKEEYYAMIAEWFTIVYGEGGDNLYEYMMMCEKSTDTMPCWSTFHSPTLHKVDAGYMAENFDYMYELFEEAEALADTFHQEHMVQLYKAGMLYACIASTHTDRYLNGTEAERAVIAERYTEMHRIFRENNILTFWDYLKAEYAPEELNLEDNPLTWCHWEALKS